MNNKKPSIKMMDVDTEIEKPKTVEKKDEKTNYLPIQELPSNYRLYEIGSKLLARPLGVREVKLLASMDENNYNFVMNDVIKKTVKGIDPNKILTDDKHFIIFWLRANSYKNSGYEVDFHCSKCEKQSKYNFGVNVLDIVYLRDDFVIGEEKELPSSKDKIVMKFKTIEDEDKILEFINRSKNSLTTYDIELMNLAGSLDKVNGESLSLLQKYNYIVDKMDAEDFSYFVSYVDAFKFGVKDVINAVCNSCKEETPIGVSFRKEFFLPQYQF